MVKIFKDIDESEKWQMSIDANRELFIENHEKYWKRIMKLNKMAEKLEE